MVFLESSENIGELVTFASLIAASTRRVVPLRGVKPGKTRSANPFAMREYQQNKPRADRPDIDRPVFHSFFHSCGKRGWRTSASWWRPAGRRPKSTENFPCGAFPGQKPAGVPPPPASWPA